VIQIRETLVSKHSEIKTKGIDLTPATRKLTKMRAGKGMGMLSSEEIELLRQSRREMAEVLRNTRESKFGNSDIANIFGILADKTGQVASLKDIEQATADGWAQAQFNGEK
jgi:hypothetical protein